MNEQRSKLDLLYDRFLALHPDVPMSHIAKPKADAPALRYITNHRYLNRHARRALARRTRG